MQLANNLSRMPYIMSFYLWKTEGYNSSPIMSDLLKNMSYMLKNMVDALADALTGECFPWVT